MKIRSSAAACLGSGLLLLLGSSVLTGCGGSAKRSVDTVVVDSTQSSASDDSALDSTALDTAALDTVDTAGVAGAAVTKGSSADSAPSGGGTVASGAPLVLTGNGVDASKFGDKFETVMSAMTTAHGAFDDDSLWEAQQSPCEGLGTKERRVQWGSVVLVFSNGPTEFGAAGVEHFISVYSEDAASPIPSIALDGKVLLDETVGGLRSRFPGVNIYTNELAGPSFQIRTAGEGEINGIISGLTDKDTVVSFNEGLICMD
jgi:hypothetical protein